MSRRRRITREEINPLMHDRLWSFWMLSLAGRIYLKPEETEGKEAEKEQEANQVKGERMKEE